MQKRTVFLVLAAVATVVTTAGCAGAAADDARALKGTTRSVTRQRTLPAGTALDLRSSVRITSASNHAGDPVSATVASPALNARGDTVIPVGAVLSGTVLRIAESGSPRSPGTLQLAFGTLTIGTKNYPVQVAITDLATHLDRAGVTTQDAATVAVGAAVGGIAGRVIGGDTRGTVIGAGAGAVGGAIYANQTRDRDIVLSSGATISAVLADPFTRSFTTRN